jgi:Transposase domain (DUF772)
MPLSALGRVRRVQYNLLFRWFVGMEMDEPVWNQAVFSKNRERLLNQEVAQAFFARVLAQAKPHLSDEHFAVDGIGTQLPGGPFPLPTRAARESVHASAATTRPIARRVGAAVTSSICILLTAQSCAAQNSLAPGTIRGTAADSSGSMVEAAIVRSQAPRSSALRTTLTDQTGSFRSKLPVSAALIVVQSQ